MLHNPRLKRHAAHLVMLAARWPQGLGHGGILLNFRVAVFTYRPCGRGANAGSTGLTAPLGKVQFLQSLNRSP